MAVPAPAGHRNVRVRRAASGAATAVVDVFRGSPLAGVEWSLSYVGFLTYIMVMTTYQLRIGDIAMAAALIGLPMERQRFRFPPLLTFMAAFTLWAGVSYLTTNHQAIVGEEWVNLLKLWLIVLVAVNTLTSLPRVRLFVIFWVVCYVLFPVRGTLVNYFVGGYTTFGRALWNFIYANPNDLAALTILHLSIAGGIYLTNKDRLLRLGALAAMLLMPIVILLTQSRGAFLGFAVFVAFALAGQRRKFRALALATMIGGIALMLVPSSAWDRFGSLARMGTSEEAIASMDEEGSAQQRWEIWRTAVRIIGDHPVTGVGWGAYPQANAFYSGYATESTNRGARDTHSTYLNVAAELGIPGLILFIGIVASVLLPANRTRRRLRTIAPNASRQLLLLQLGMLGFLIAGIFASYAALSFPYLQLALLCAGAQLWNEHLQREHRRVSRTGNLASL